MSPLLLMIALWQHSTSFFVCPALLLQRDVYDSVVTLVEEHNADHPSKTVDLTLVTLPRLEELHNLLKPLGDATDRLQGDGLTSAIVHLCISTSYTQVKSYPAEV